jgi:hypothetical protein
MTAIEVTIQSIEEFDEAFGSIGTGRLTKEDKEWFVLRQFMKAAIMEVPFLLPLTVRKACPPDPDFIVLDEDRKETVALIEITIASNETDQEERSKIDGGDQAGLLGVHGGRTAANPERTWVKDVITAIRKKRMKIIFRSSHQNRHLTIRLQTCLFCY